MTTTEKIIEKYLGFGGERKYDEFVKFLTIVDDVKASVKRGSRDFVCLEYIQTKLRKGRRYASEYGQIYVVIEDTIADIERGYDEPNEVDNKRPLPQTRSSVKRKPKSRKKGLGKLVDDGEVTKRGNSDIYWRKKGIKIVFTPNDKHVRVGEHIPDTYHYLDMRFLEDYYNLRAFEFGNWLSQQDRVNYLAGMGIALFDLHKALGFAPTKIGLKKKIAIAFGARGRGSAVAHFEPGSFTINLTRYKRPRRVENRPAHFERVKLLLRGGGVGSFAHEYGHALDTYGGLKIERGNTFSLSGDKNTNTKPTEHFKKNTLKGLMERLLQKIFWKAAGKHSDYYNRLLKATKQKYFIQRNEIFARAFEVYVQYKLAKKKHVNIFLNEVKYDKDFYLTLNEMKKIEKEFDALMNALKKHL